MGDFEAVGCRKPRWRTLRLPGIAIVLSKLAITADRTCASPAASASSFFHQLQTDCELMARRRQIADQLKAIRPRA
jgi:hypothetical protein